VQGQAWRRVSDGSPTEGEADLDGATDGATGVEGSDPIEGAGGCSGDPVPSQQYHLDPACGIPTRSDHIFFLDASVRALVYTPVCFRFFFFISISVLPRLESGGAMPDPKR